MNEEIEYAEMLEIPVSTVNVVRKRRRKKTDLPIDGGEQKSNLKDSVIATVNDRLREEPAPLDGEAATPSPEENTEEGGLRFEPVPERIDTVRLYSADGEDNTLTPYDYTLNEGGRYKMKELPPKKIRLALGIEFGAACTLCGAIFLTNVFMPTSAINTFFRAIGTPSETQVTRPYTDFTLTPVVSGLSDAKLQLSDSGILSFTDECCVYPAADGRVSELIKDKNGLYTLKISYSDSFTGVIDGLDVVYYAVGDEVKANVPVGFSEGESEVQVTMYSEGELLNCFQLTEENCLAWVPQK